MRRLGRLRYRTVARLRLRPRRHDRRRAAEVRCVVLFVGNSRTGSTLVGQLLNAHRNAVIANEADLLSKLEAGCSRDELFAWLIERDRTFAAASWRTAGYSFQVPGQWQGRVERLDVIGAKRAHSTTRTLYRSPELLQRLRETTGTPIRFVHVVRHPLDAIATMAARTDRSLEDTATKFFHICHAVESLKQELDEREILDVRSEDVVAGPAHALTSICSHVGLAVSDDYLSACASVVFPSSRRSRGSVEWPRPLVTKIAERAAQFPFLSRYDDWQVAAPLANL